MWRRKVTGMEVGGKGEVRPGGCQTERERRGARFIPAPRAPLLPPTALLLGRGLLRCFLGGSLLCRLFRRHCFLGGFLRRGLLCRLLHWLGCFLCGRLLCR